MVALVAVAACGGQPAEPTIGEATPDMIQIFLLPDLPGSVGGLFGEAERIAREHCAEYGREAVLIGQTSPPRPGWPVDITFACR